MNKKLALAVIAALGATSQNAWAEDTETGEITVTNFNLQGLHPETVRVLARMRAAEAMQIVRAESGAELRIEPSRLPDDLFARIQMTENANLDEESGEYVLTDSLSAAIAASGELTSGNKSTTNAQVEIDELIEKVGSDLDDSILKHGVTNLM